MFGAQWSIQSELEQVECILAEQRSEPQRVDARPVDDQVEAVDGFEGFYLPRLGLNVRRICPSRPTAWATRPRRCRIRSSAINASCTLTKNTPRSVRAILPKDGGRMVVRRRGPL
jgi:hypothetical protein